MYIYHECSTDLLFEKGVIKSAYFTNLHEGSRMIRLELSCPKIICSPHFSRHYILSCIFFFNFVFRKSKIYFLKWTKTVMVLYPFLSSWRACPSHLPFILQTLLQHIWAAADERPQQGKLPVEVAALLGAVPQIKPMLALFPWHTLFLAETSRACFPLLSTIRMGKQTRLILLFWQKVIWVVVVVFFWFKLFSRKYLMALEHTLFFQLTTDNFHERKLW